MKINQTMQFLNKVFNLCQKNGILNVNIRRNAVTELKYGPLGYLLKRNIYREWLDSCLNNSDINALPLHINKSSNESINQINVLLQEIAIQCKQFPPALYVKAPYAFAVRTQHSLDTADNGIIESNDLDFIWSPKQKTVLSIAILCEPQKATFWYHYWQRQRYVWWRKFSMNPSQFSISDSIRDTADGCQTSLLFQHPSLNGSLENINKIDDIKLTEIFDDKSSSLICQLDLDFALLIYLCNAFEEMDNGKHKAVLRLHHKFAPYKIATIIECSDEDSAKRLKDVSYRLSKEFKKSGISVLPYVHQRLVPTEESFDRFDEMGIPYAIILCQKSLATGIVRLRNRDTTLQEQIHVTELTSKLQLYLQMSVISNEAVS